MVIAVKPSEAALLQAKQWQARGWLEANAFANTLNLRWKKYFAERTKHKAKVLYIDPFRRK